MSEESPFRSEEMLLVQLMIPREACAVTVEVLGELECVQFIDADANTQKNNFSRPFSKQIRMCDDLLRRLRFFRERAKKLGLYIDEQNTVLPFSMKDRSLDEMQTDMAGVEADLRALNGRNEMMLKTYKEMVEHQFLLKNTLYLMDKSPKAVAHSMDSLPAEDSPLIEEGGAADGRTLRMIAGVIEADKIESLERLSFRISRGNALVRYSEPLQAKDKPDAPILAFEEEKTESEGTVAFIIFFSGRVLQDKLSKLITTLGGRKYQLPADGVGQARLSLEVAQSLEDHRNVLKAAQKTESALLEKYVDALPALERRVRERLGIYYTMNKFNYGISSQAAVAEAWIPAARLKDDVAPALTQASDRAGAGTPTVITILQPSGSKQPPTFIKTNKLTSMFQGLNDAYGTPAYRELNPGIFYPVTYSFLFGIMFGDIGHGLLLLLSALYLVLNERMLGGMKLNELLQPAYEGRYLLLLMGIFSVYCGFIYNECFGRPLMPWSYYSVSCAEGARSCDALPAAVPPAGVDPIWGLAENKLAYVNSLKMKLSILIGVAHMTFGLGCKTANCIYFRRWKDLIFENVAEFLFLWSLFGYLSVLIVLKWGTDWVGLELRPPSLLDTLLHMLLSPGAEIPPDARLYPGQGAVQVVLVVIALLCVPWMLLLKPLLLAREHRGGYKPIADGGADGDEEEAGGGSPHGGDGGARKRAQQLQQHAGDAHGGGAHGGGGHGEDGEEFDLQEVFIHQMIHTIEFVLGSVSNTASYLRLWALSLAHAGLSEVFWERVLMAGLELDLGSPWAHAAAVWAAFAVWAAMTVGVLLVMETLSAMLHDIRLHWVEFQNKFYRGDGRAFAPLSLRAVGAGEADPAGGAPGEAHGEGK